ncbi:MAG: flagellar protein FlaG [Desulfobacterales bacterium]|nr:flagellar protein FlaG [Desulfobacterales bacterium]
MNPISSVQPAMPPRQPSQAVTEAAPAAATISVETQDAANQDMQKREEAQLETTKASLEDPLKDEALSQDTLDDISRDLESLHSVALSFSRHEGTGRTMVRVLNRDTQELIREIPSEKVLDIASKIGEMVGLLFDEKV